MQRLNRTFDDLFTFLFSAGVLGFVLEFQRAAIGYAVLVLCSGIAVKWFREPITSDLPRTSTQQKSA